MAGNQSENLEIKCPYYKKSGCFYIECEGIAECDRTTVGFSTYGKREEFKTKYCKEYPNRCMVAEMLDKKYL